MLGEGLLPRVRLYLVRHGQSQANANLSIRNVNSDLTELGKEQATSVAARLASEHLTHLYCSPYRRTVDTAREISQACGLECAFLPVIHEHHGAIPPDWHPYTRTELEALFPAVCIPAHMPEAGWHAFPETIEQVRERMQRALEEIRDANPAHARIALISHASPIQQFIGVATTAYTASEATQIAIGNASLTILDLDFSPAAVIGGMGQVAHLSQPLPVLL